MLRKGSCIARVACCLPRFVLPVQVRSLLVVSKVVQLLLTMLAPQVRPGWGL